MYVPSTLSNDALLERIETGLEDFATQAHWVFYDVCAMIDRLIAQLDEQLPYPEEEEKLEFDPRIVYWNTMNRILGPWAHLDPFLHTKAWMENYPWILSFWGHARDCVREQRDISDYSEIFQQYCQRRCRGTISIFQAHDWLDWDVEDCVNPAFEYCRYRVYRINDLHEAIARLRLELKKLEEKKKE